MGPVCCGEGGKKVGEAMLLPTGWALAWAASPRPGRSRPGRGEMRPGLAWARVGIPGGNHHNGVQESGGAGLTPPCCTQPCASRLHHFT